MNSQYVIIYKDGGSKYLIFYWNQKLIYGIYLIHTPQSKYNWFPKPPNTYIHLLQYIQYYEFYLLIPYKPNTQLD